MIDFALIKRGWHWWKREAASLLPKAVQTRLDVFHGKTFLEITPDGLRLFSLRNGVIVEKPPSRNAIKKPQSVIGVIAPASVLTRTMSLPVAAKPHLADAIRYQLDRLSPFPPDQTEFRVQSLTVQKDEIFLSVKVDMVSKTTLDALDQAAALQGNLIIAFATAAAGSAPSYAMFSSRDNQRLWQLENLVVAGSSLLLALVVIAIPFWREIATKQRLDEQTVALKPKVDEVLKLKANRDRGQALKIRVR